MKLLFLNILLFGLALGLQGQNSIHFSGIPSEVFLEAIDTEEDQEIARKKNIRITAAVLAITLGPFGAHRIYLGCNEKVPIFYTLTLGGGLGLLPLIDLGHIIFTKDLSGYYQNDKVFMWGGN